MAADSPTPEIITWNGRNIEELTREELIEVVRVAYAIAASERDRADATSRIASLSRKFCVNTTR